MNKKRLKVFLAILAAVLLSLPTVALGAEEVPRMSTDELKARLGSPGLLVVDVRAGGSWEGSDHKILGAERVGPPDLDSWAATHDKRDTIVLYCS